LQKHLILPKPRRRVGGLHMPCSLPGRWWEQTCLKKAVHKIKTLPCDKQKEKNKLNCRTEDKLWDKHPYLALVNMHLRFDGRLGFPGGIIDPGETIELALNREISEEMGPGNPEVLETDWISSTYSPGQRLLMHFYCKEISKEEFHKLEKRGLSAEEYGVEILGILRVPLYTRPRNRGGFPEFLKNNFAGNARENLLVALRERGVLGEAYIEESLKWP